MGLHTHLGELNCKVEVQLEWRCSSRGGVEVGRSATSYHVTYRRALTLLELGGREEPLSISLGKKHSLYTRIQPLLSSLFSLYSAARRVLPEIGPWQCCNPNKP